MKTIARELYGKVIVNYTIAGRKCRFISLILASKSWKGGGMIDCNVLYVLRL